MKTSSAVTVASLLTLAPAIVGAQVCAGLAPFERRPVQALATAAKMHGAMSVDGGVAIGNRTAFSRLRAGRSSLQGRDGAALQIAGGGGVEFPGGPRETVRVCVLGNLGITTGPRSVETRDAAGNPMRVDLSAVEWSVGMTAGATRSITRGPLLFPTGSFMIVSGTSRVKEQYSGSVTTQSRVFGIIETGVGVVLGRMITVRPALTIPVGLPRAGYGGTVTISTALGGR